MAPKVSYDKVSLKSQPIGIRFNLKDIDFALAHSKIKTKQGMVDFLLAEYCKQFRADKQAPIFNGGMPQERNDKTARQSGREFGDYLDGKKQDFNYFLNLQKDLNEEQECLDYVARVEVSDLLWNEKKILKERLKSKFI